VPLGFRPPNLLSRGQFTCDRTSIPAKWHLILHSGFSRVQECDRQTHRRTTHGYICRNRQNETGNKTCCLMLVTDKMNASNSINAQLKCCSHHTVICRYTSETSHSLLTKKSDAKFSNTTVMRLQAAASLLAAAAAANSSYVSLHHVSYFNFTAATASDSSLQHMPTCYLEVLLSRLISKDITTKNVSKNQCAILDYVTPRQTSSDYSVRVSQLAASHYRPTPCLGE